MPGVSDDSLRADLVQFDKTNNPPSGTLGHGRAETPGPAIRIAVADRLITIVTPATQLRCRSDLA
jgi:hypothetical protein